MLKLIRPHHWIKNLLLFAALFFSKSFFDTSKIILALEAFTLFSLLASSIYVINDIFDVERDRQHPTKKNRPIASGEISIKRAIIIALTLFFIAMTGALLISLNFAYVLLAYFIINIFYSAKLKHVVIIDAFVVAFGFVLRVVAGALAIDVRVSHWILICTFTLALFLAFGKRRGQKSFFL